MIAAIFVAVCATSRAALPNLTPFQPAGWSDKIVVATTQNTTTDSTNLTTTNTLYVSWSVINNGAAAVTNAFYTALYIDGVYQTEWLISPPFGVNSYVTVSNYSIGSLTAGTHTIEIYADSTGVVAESNESDNTYTKTITVTGQSLPNLTPYQPAGWSDKIVVATNQNTTTDSTGLTPAETLYVNWCIINDGNVAVSNAFYTALYVDGVYQTEWQISPPLDVNSYIYFNNYSIGMLSAGTHTLEIVADSTGVITELYTNDNTYTKTITVTQSNLPAPTLISPANGATGQSTSPTFTWSAVPGATSYRILVATNLADLTTNASATNGGPSVAADSVVTNTSFTPTMPFIPTTTYYWEVNAHNAAEFGTWSGTNSFTTAAVAGGITIIPTFDSSITSDPQAAVIEATIRSALVPYQTDFSDAITVTIKFEEMSSGLGESSWLTDTYSYSTYRAALATNATTTDDMTALAHLPISTGNPVNGNQNVEVKLPLARALGFNANPGQGQMDGTVYLNTSIMNLSAGQMNPANYSLFATVSHEVDEVLALGSALDQVNDGNITLTGVIFPEDLFRYDQTGARSYTTASNATAYFSLDGTTDLAQFNQVGSGDYGDWYSFYGGQTPQVQDAFSTPDSWPVLGVELRALDALGFHLIAANKPVLQIAAHTGNTLTFSWTAVSGQNYQVQSATNINQTTWTNLGSSITATGTTASFTNTVGPDVQRFYRVQALSASLVLAKGQVEQTEAGSGPSGSGTSGVQPSQR